MNKTHDDWMHPQLAAQAWQAPKRPDIEFLIMRQRVLVCTWMGDGPPTEWAEWRAFDTREKRDAEFRRLRETTEWTLKKGRRDHGRYQDEDDVDDLRARLRMAEAIAQAEARALRGKPTP